MKFEFLYATKIINLYVIYKKLKLKKKNIFLSYVSESIILIA